MYNETHPTCSLACHCAINGFGRIENCHTHGCLMSRIETGQLEKENTALVKIRLEKENESLRECIQGLQSNLAAYRRHEDTKDDIRDWNT